METGFDTRCDILADLWMNYRSDEEFADFVEYSDLGLPMSYMVANGLGSASDIGVKFINETWELFLGALGLEDRGFESLDDVLASAGE